jgi:hypothetical protein
VDVTFLSDAEESLRHQDGVIRRQREALAEIRDLCLRSSTARVSSALVLEIIRTVEKDT